MDGDPGRSEGGSSRRADLRATADLMVTRTLRAVREHLGLEVAFVGEVVGHERIFRYVDTDSAVDDVVAVGGRDPLEDSYCGHVLAGRLPQYLPDPAADPLARTLPVTSALPVGTHLSVPIRFSDGHVYGTFCAFATDVRQSVQAHDVRTMTMAAALAAGYLEELARGHREQQERRKVIQSVIEDPNGMEMVFQPLLDLSTMQVVALEALARFPNASHRPQWFFTEAAHVGLGIESEVRAVQLALRALPDIPEPIRLNVNVSPETACSLDFLQVMSAVPADRLVVEVTEHAAIEDYEELKQASARLTDMSICMAIDDVGMGFSGLNRILETSPAELKLDAAVIRDVDTNPLKQALVEAFCSFGQHAGLDIVAEGIETAAELDMLRSLGVRIAQGYHLGRPGPLDHALQRHTSLSRRS